MGTLGAALVGTHSTLLVSVSIAALQSINLDYLLRGWEYRESVRFWEKNAHLHTCRGDQRTNGRAEARIIPCQAAPRPTTGAIKPFKPIWLKSRMHTSNKNPVWGCHRTASAAASGHGAHHPYHQKPWVAALPKIFQTKGASALEGDQEFLPCIMGCMKNIAQDCTILIGYLGMELKAGKNRQPDILEKEKGTEKKEG